VVIPLTVLELPALAVAAAGGSPAVVVELVRMAVLLLTPLLELPALAVVAAGGSLACAEWATVAFACAGVAKNVAELWVCVEL